MKKTKNITVKLNHDASIVVKIPVLYNHKPLKPNDQLKLVEAQASEGSHSAECDPSEAKRRRKGGK